jgi:signal-transduction protein with cAMP-binding, CBS, and nucleotidyltransferase domain
MVKGNRLFDAFPPECLEFLQGRVSDKPIAGGEVLLDVGNPLQSMILVHDGLVSMRIQVADNRFVEAVSFGQDGVIGGNISLVKPISHGERLPSFLAALHGCR